MIESDTIHEEIEIEDDDDLLSENNFYLAWQNHKRFLLTKDEQQKIYDEDSKSSSGFGHRPGLSSRIHPRKGRKRQLNKPKSDLKLLDPKEEKRDDPIDEIEPDECEQ